LRLRDEGVIVLGVYRQVEGREVYIGAPRPDFVLRAGDRMVCYGPEDVLRELPERMKGPEGDLEHALAVARQRMREMAEEREAEEAEVKTAIAASGPAEDEGAAAATA